jgi:AhpD family alkylhydroperoxidase
MEPRIDFTRISPGAYKAMAGVEAYVRGCGLEPTLLKLVKVRASQINGCAFCIDMHWKEARAAGETEQRLYGLGAWEESPYYTDRERAALRWTEAVTLVAEGHVPDAAFDAVRPHFDDKQLADLTLAITTINAWNRLSTAFRTVPGSFRPAEHQHQG